jgi:hypothetical protein
MPSADVAAQITKFLSRYTPDIAAQLTQARRAMRSAFPRGYELVFDNYNALVFAISPSERPADAFVSVAGYPRWVTLFFLHGAQLKDPAGLLEGSGKQVRSIRLTAQKRISAPEVKALVKQASAAHEAAFEIAPKLVTVVKTALAEQRARRPTAKSSARSAAKKSELRANKSLTSGSRARVKASK